MSNISIDPFASTSEIPQGVTLTENGTVVRHWIPKIVGGNPGLYDTVNESFISSETSNELVAVYSNS